MTKEKKEELLKALEVIKSVCKETKTCLECPLRCACRMTIRHWLADMDVRFTLEEEHKLMDELEKLWDERDKRRMWGTKNELD